MCVDYPLAYKMTYMWFKKTNLAPPNGFHASDEKYATVFGKINRFGRIGIGRS